MKNNYTQSQISFSQEEFIRFCYLSLLKREADEKGLNDWLKYLNNNPSLEEMVESFIKSDEFLNKLYQAEMESILGKTPCILGEKKPLTLNEILSWYQKAGEQLINHFKITETSDLQINNSIDAKYSVAIITSLYRGEKYIKCFLKNIVSQTIFNKCQLIIIDANSPENEQEVIQLYCNRYKNIKYIRLSEKINIYEAWNLAINYSDTEYIINANVDDLHRYDALELKVQAFKNHPQIDVVYSDVYYSFLANFPFEKTEICGLKTSLPIANKDNLMLFNSPNYSPMWRRTLHDKIGYFSTKYQSAADYEFWLRAAFSEVKFIKISEPVTSYYNNPQGLSTKKDTKSIEESNEILNFYKNLLDSSNSEPWHNYYCLIYETIKISNQQLQHYLQQQELTKLESILKEMLSSKFLIIRSYLLKIKTFLILNSIKNNHFFAHEETHKNLQNTPYSYLFKNSIPKETEEKLIQFEQEIKQQYLTIKEIKEQILLINHEIETLKKSKFWYFKNIWFGFKQKVSSWR